MDSFPVEVLLKILSYLGTYDLLQFCEAYGNDCFLKEKHLIELVDFSRNFELQNINLSSCITTRLNPFHIKILNINYLYWIPAAQLRNLIKRLENLNVLLALDTKLGLNNKDVAEYINLKKIAVSIEDNQFEYSTIVASKKLTNLKSLCLKITQKSVEQSGIYLFFREIKQLEELWIYDDNESNYRIDYYQLVVILKRLKKFVIKSKVALPYYDFRCDGIHPTFECKRSGSATEFIFEKHLIIEQNRISIFEPKESELEKSWEVFEKLHKDLPCGIKESRQICMKKDIKTVYFEDLNFCHAVILCNSKYINAALQILMSQNSTRLKRLSFRSCIFQDAEFDSKRSVKRDEKTLGFKRPRKGIQINSTNHAFHKVANNIKSLRELEIYTCPGCSGEVELSAYPLIHTFENLHKLTLEVPLLMDGVFLKEFFIKCHHLESLNLIFVGQNEKFTFNLFQNLKYSTNLRDFRLDCKDIAVDKLLSCFCDLKERNKLLRFFLKCDNLQHGYENLKDSLVSFMTKNAQLVLFLLIIGKTTMKQNSDIQKVLNEFKKGNPAKIFYIKNDISMFTGVFPVPPAHHDMIFNYTNVSVINIDDF